MYGHTQVCVCTVCVCSECMCEGTCAEDTYMGVTGVQNPPPIHNEHVVVGAYRQLQVHIHASSAVTCTKSQTLQELTWYDCT